MKQFNRDSASQVLPEPTVSVAATSLFCHPFNCVLNFVYYPSLLYIYFCSCLHIRCPSHTLLHQTQLFLCCILLFLLIFSHVLFLSPSFFSAPLEATLLTLCSLFALTSLFSCSYPLSSCCCCCCSACIPLFHLTYSGVIVRYCVYPRYNFIKQ